MDEDVRGAEAAGRHTATTSGGELAYLDAGDGPAVVLLHGFPTSSHLWRHVVPEVVRAGMRAIVPDQLGFGASDKPDGVALHPRAQAGYVRELLGVLGIDRFAVVGHDLGGAVAQLMALEGGAEAIALVDAAAFDAWPIEGVRMIQDAEPEQETPEFVASIIELALDLGLTNKDVLTREMVEAYVGPFAGDEGAHAFFRAARAIDGVGLTGREDDLAALDIPALLVWGEDDPYLGTELADRLVEVLARPSLVLLPGCAHFTPEEAPDTLAPLLAQFLAANWLGRPVEHHHEGHGHGPAEGPVMVRLERRGEA
ncbi:MAG TPA: alpha/beta hydrolase [Actinomycetota bacterium]